MSVVSSMPNYLQLAGGTSLRVHRDGTLHLKRQWACWRISSGPPPSLMWRHQMDKIASIQHYRVYWSGCAKRLLRRTLHWTWFRSVIRHALRYISFGSYVEPRKRTKIRHRGFYSFVERPLIDFKLTSTISDRHMNRFYVCTPDQRCFWTNSSGKPQIGFIGSGKINSNATPPAPYRR